MARWRSSFYKLVPSWLSIDDGELVLHTLGRLTDGFIERARLSLTARFPTYSGPTGLAMLGDERGIVKGRNENNDGYARRLRGWRGPRGHQVRGNPFAMLYQIWNYFGGMTVQECDASGNVFTTARDGTETVDQRASVANRLNWDGVYAWPRFWLKIVPEDDQGIKAHPTFGQVEATGKTFGQAEAAGDTWGQTGVTVGDADTVKNLFHGDHPWKMAGTKAEYALLVLGQDETPVPDGTWGHWTHNGVATRSGSWRYWKL